jgi:GYF domain 2
MPDTAPPRRQRWFVDVDSKTYGPYDESTIAQMVEGGQIMRNDLVVREGASDWVEGAKEPALGRLFRSKSAEPPIRRKRRWTSKLVLAGCFAITLVWIAWLSIGAQSGPRIGIQEGPPLSTL